MKLKGYKIQCLPSFLSSCFGQVWCFLEALSNMPLHDTDEEKICLTAATSENLKVRWNDYKSEITLP